MTLLPDLEAELVAAAGRRRRPRAVVIAALVATVGVGLAIVAISPLEGSRQDAAQPRPQVPNVPAATLKLSRALAMEQVRVPESVHERVLHRDLPGVAEQIELETPYPPGVKDTFDWAATPNDPQNMGSFNVRADVRSFIHFRAWCFWQSFWLQAHDARAVQPAANAAQVLTDSTQWVTKPGGPRSRAIAEAARRNQPAPIRRYTELNCTPSG